MTNEPLTPERAARLLRAKAGELEHVVRVHYQAAEEAGGQDVTFDVNLAADVALVATLLADHIERNDGAEFLSNVLQRLYGPGPAGDTIRVNEDGTPWTNPDQP